MSFAPSCSTRPYVMLEVRLCACECGRIITPKWKKCGSGCSCGSGSWTQTNNHGRLIRYAHTVTPQAPGSKAPQVAARHARECVSRETVLAKLAELGVTPEEVSKRLGIKLKRLAERPRIRRDRAEIILRAAAGLPRAPLRQEQASTVPTDPAFMTLAELAERERKRNTRRKQAIRDIPAPAEEHHA